MSETIAAISTATGSGGIGIVRLSGDRAKDLGQKMFRTKNNEPLDLEKHRYLQYGHIVENDHRIDEVLCVFMKGPGTYTREDMVEIYCHGGRIALSKVLDYCLRLGARLAEPGEFTKRAFLNGRLDLSQAESVIDLIDAKSSKAYDQGMLQLSGALGEEFRKIENKLMELSGLIVANIDFPEDDIEILNREKLEKISEDLDKRVNHLIQSASRGKMLKDGIKTVIVGKPNVGKSSLLNVLLKEDRAIVTDIPGTTRDSIEEYISLDDVVLHIIDTAGIRDTEDKVEKIGVERSVAAMDQADIILALFDQSRPLDQEDKNLLDLLKGRKVFYILNKQDLSEGPQDQEMKEFFQREEVFSISALNKEGIEDLEEALKKLYYTGEVDSQDLAITNVRQLDVLRRTKKSIEAIKDAVKMDIPMDCIEVDVKEALDSIGEITGKTLTEDILDRIFHEFCIGK